MPHLCTECSRLNPSAAVFCWYDGFALDGNAAVPGEGSSINMGIWAFPTPFVFPGGATCRNFLQLALACQRNPQEAIDVLQQGFLESFFSMLGRADLAITAKTAAKNPDRDRGLDDLLGRLPGSPLEAPVLHVAPDEIEVGVVPVGEDRRFELTLSNKKDRLLVGKATVGDCPWLGFGDSGTPEKLFQFFDEMKLPVRILGSRLRAFSKPQKAEIALETNGGNIIVTVQITVPVKPFPDGLLGGATSPRELASKAKTQPKEAAVLIENGAVRRWYEVNGWTYPVQGPTASGVAAVQQLFETLGLVKAPKVELTEPSVALRGKAGERLEAVITVTTQEKRAAIGYGVSDQPWLAIGKTVCKGQTATIPLTVEMVPNEPNATLKATVKVTANGNQRFDVPVTLHVGDGPPVRPMPPSSVPTLTPSPTLAASAAVPMVVEAVQEVVEVVEAAPAPGAIRSTAPPPVSVVEAVTAPAGVTLAPTPSVTLAPPPRSVGESGGGLRRAMMRLLPLGIVFFGLLIAVTRDLWPQPVEEQLLPVDYDNPPLALRFHEKLAYDDFLRPRTQAATMRFGLGVVDPEDPKKFRTRLIYDEFGRTCNVCVRIDNAPPDGFLWGIDNGRWLPPMRQELGEDKETQKKLLGARAYWVHTRPPITIMQYVELVPGGLSADRKMRVLDTCLIRYDITNNAKVPHKVGLRFLLDTFIGNNDAVPFTVAGAKEQIKDVKTFNSPKEVPDFIQALENPDLNKPGLVAHLNLRFGEGLEPPTRVTLGAWPLGTLRETAGGEKAERQDTLWDVPALSMALAKKSPDNPNGDSAITLYWDDEVIPPQKTRTVGFSYGLGSITGDKHSGQIAVTAGGEMVRGKKFTVTALIKEPALGTTVTLRLPEGMKLVEDELTKEVKPLPADSKSRFSEVSWEVEAERKGTFEVEARTSAGAAAKHRFSVKEAKKALQ